MSDEVNPLPSTLAALVADLEARGFKVAERRSSTNRTSINEFGGRRSCDDEPVRSIRRRLRRYTAVGAPPGVHSKAVA